MIAAAVALLPGLAALASGPSAGQTRDATAYVTDGPVHAVAHEPGGNTYIGGDFSHVGPRSGHGLSLGAVGSSDEALPDSGVELSAPGFPEVAGGEVHAVVSDQNGGWFIGGDFRSVAGQEVPRLAHILPTGQLDTSWAPEPNNTVLALALDSTTSATEWTLYAGGKFTQIETSGAKSYLAAWRIGSDGIPASPGDLDDDDVDDPSTEPLKWAPGTNQAGGAPVHALAVRTHNVNVGPAPATPTPTPVVFAAGEFTSIGKGTPVGRNRLAAVWGEGARKAADGTDVQGVTIESWNPTTANQAGNKVTALALGPAADAVAGTHTVTPVYYGGTFTGNLAANKFDLDEALGTAAAAASYSGWTPAPNTNGAVSALTLNEASNTLYIGGGFTTITAGNTPRARLAAVAAIPAGAVTTANCVPVACPATLSNWAPNANGSVRAIAVSEDGSTVYAGGSFTSIGAGTPAVRNGLTALVGAGATGPSGETEGSALLGWDARPAGGSTNALALQGDSLYAGGGFYSIGASERGNLAALDSDGVLVDEFDTGTSCEGAGCRDDVRALELAPDAKQLYVGGAFSRVGGEPRAHLAALNLDPVPPDAPGTVVPDWDPNPDWWVLSLDVAGGTLYAGGAFDHIGEPDTLSGLQPVRHKLAALDRVTGALRDWDPDAKRLGPGVDPEECDQEPELCQEPFNVYDIEASCETVYAGGSFNRIGADPPGDATQPERNAIAELDPATAAATPWNPDPNSVVRALAVDGDIVYVGGDFATIGDSSVPNGKATRSYIAALRRSDGSATGWNPSADYKVRALDVSGDGETVYAGGSFNEIGGEDRLRLAALAAGGIGNATSWNPSASHVNPNEPSAVRALTVATTEDPDGDGPSLPGDGIYLGGEFTDLGTSSQRGYAQFRTYDLVTGRELASTDPFTCASDQEQQPPADTTPPDLGQPSVADGGQTLVLGLSEPADVHVDLTGSAPGLMSVGTDAACLLDTAELRAQLQRALRSKVRSLPPRKRAKKLRKLIAKRACSVTLPPDQIDADGIQGENRISLGEGEMLTAGSYRATISATDGAGNAAQPRSIDFQVGP